MGQSDYDAERFRVFYDGNITDLRGRMAKTFWWEMVPLPQPKESGIDLFDAERKCLIFKWPEPGYIYGIGVDNSRRDGQGWHLHLRQREVDLLGRAGLSGGLFLDEPRRPVTDSPIHHGAGFALQDRDAAGE